MSRTLIPDRNEIDPDTPLRLDVAAALAYPDGSMTGSGLRLEASRGKLVMEHVAGRYYTTLANIQRMREKCRVADKDHGSRCGRPGAIPAPDASPIPQPGASSTDATSAAQAAALTIVEELSAISPATSRKNTSTGRVQGNVIRAPFRSPTRSRSTGAK